MKIEDRIHQKKFRSEYHKLLANLAQISGRISFEQQKILKPFDVSFQQYNVLCILRGQYPESATVYFIKTRVVEQNADVSRIVDRLLRKKLVQRTVCPKDRRKVDILITEKGMELLRRIDRHTTKFDRILSHISAAEAERLNALLDKLRK